MPNKGRIQVRIIIHTQPHNTLSPSPSPYPPLSITISLTISHNLSSKIQIPFAAFAIVSIYLHVTLYDAFYAQHEENSKTKKKIVAINVERKK